MKAPSLNPTDMAGMIEKSSAATVEPVERTMERLLEIASVKSVYDSPVQHGKNMIIPAAEVLGALGFGVGVGVGSGEYPDKEDAVEEGEGAEDEEKTSEPSESGPGKKAPGIGGGGGGGGGGRVFARPVAIIVSGPDGVEVEPVVDATKIALAFFTALGFMVSMAARMRRGPSRQE